MTDHDTTAGLAACADACKQLGVIFVPGIELSADPGSVRSDGESRGTLHILGYGINDQNETLKKIEVQLREAREKRNPEMVDRLRELGVEITYDEVVALAGGNIVGRPHIAQVLVEKGYVRSMHEAFERYIGMRGAAYVRKDRLSAADAIAAIRNAGGIAVLAHPIQLGIDDPDDLEHVVAKLADSGLSGLETRHSDHDAAEVRAYTELAQSRNLLMLGGSDYHGSRKAVKMGDSGISQADFKTLWTAL